MSCHLWNINKKFVSILEIKINELEGQVPKDTFKNYLDILIAIKNNKNIIKKKHLGRKFKTESYRKHAIQLISQQRNLDMIRFTTVCCCYFWSRWFVCTENLKALKLIPSHPRYCYQIEKQVLAPREAVPRAWCTEIWRIPHVTHPSLPQYLIRKSVGMWQPFGGASAPYVGFVLRSKWDVCKKKRPSLSRLGQSKGLGMKSACHVTCGEQSIGECPLQPFFSPHLYWWSKSHLGQTGNLYQKTRGLRPQSTS